VVWRIVFLVTVSASLWGAIENYHPTHQAITFQGKHYIALREFVEQDERFFLAVDVDTLLVQRIKQFYAKPNATRSSNYSNALKAGNSGPFPLRNDGVKEALFNTQEFFLSVDLCPSSKKGFEGRLFEELRTYQKGFPVVICVSGTWIETHEEEFRSLLSMNRRGDLSITWCNHTNTHFYHPNVPLEHNFMLQAPESFEHEVLELEKILLERGTVPSIFFRFPGLISNQGLVERLNTLGLVALGAQSWIAKGEKPNKGGIILIHGNNNEPEGVRGFLKWLKRERGIRFLPIERVVSAGQ